MSGGEQQLAPDGYRQTEIGVLPVDWDVARLLDVATLIHGKAHEPFVDALGQFVVVNSKFVSTTGKVRKRCTQNTCPARKGDVLMVLSDLPNGKALAKCYLVEQEDIFAVNQRVCIFRATKVNPVFLFYMINRHRYFLSLDDGVTQTHILNNDIAACSISLPSEIEEQTAIANALSDVDALITSLERLIAKKRAMKTAAMQQLLTGKKRLPPFDQSHTGYKQTELGEIPEDWDVRSVGDFTNCTAGGTPSTQVSAYWGGAHPWMSSGELHLRTVCDVQARITDLGLEKSSTKYVPKKCVLIGLAGQGKTRGTVAVNEIDLCTNQSIAAIFPSSEHSTDFLYYTLDNRYEELRTLSTGDGGRGGLNLTIIKKLQVAFPSLNEQREISLVLRGIDEEIGSVLQRLQKTQQLKQGMMQELLTGRTRLI